MIKHERNRLIVLSLDAVGSMDLPYMNTLPHFRAFFKRAAGCGRVLSVYPSLTYPAHTSIVTGLYPARHGRTKAGLAVAEALYPGHHPL